MPTSDFLIVTTILQHSMISPVFLILALMSIHYHLSSFIDAFNCCSINEHTFPVPMHSALHRNFHRVITSLHRNCRTVIILFGDKCDFLQWVDPVWPSSLIKSLSKLWEIYTKVRDGRVRDAFNNVETRFKFIYEIEKLHCDPRNAQDELKQMVQENQVTLAMKAKAGEALADARAELDEKKKLDTSTTNMHNFFLVKAKKERDRFKEDKE
ncbi:hypothetical protein D1007_38022 [Hordeum vulgare]|nr:hypothetical protein D1007_38022 [Hordeum vulgare]